MLRHMSTVLLKADLDSASKVIDNSDALLLWYSVDLLRYCFLELRDGLRIVPVHVIYPSGTPTGRNLGG